MFKLNYKDGAAYYTISSFEESGIVKHCFTTRLGGVSKGCYASMNLRSHSGDDWNNVLQNFQIISDIIGIDRDRLVLSKQTHDDVIHTVADDDLGNGILRENKFESADALITDKPNAPIAVFSADCVPLFFLDTKNRVIALAHSGWRGTVKRIGQKTIEKMKNDYNSNPENILTAIGPSIQEECFEVGDDVAEIFINEFGAETAKKYGEKYHVNMQKAIRAQFLEAGIPASNIDDSGICTRCQSGLLFSHRKAGDKRGNLGAFLQLV
ncbi:MAG: peptidoglycan editing factor PgeF [Firmicutes bacterium]|nr:peptidoglycan editing factor PgeF [Bacillota bacterium]